MNANSNNYALFSGVPKMCVMYGCAQSVSSLKIGISPTVLRDVEVALNALQSVLEFKSFNHSPKIIFNLSALPNAFEKLEIISQAGEQLDVDDIELIVTSNGEHKCLVLAFVDGLTNTSRWEILLNRIY